MIGSLVLLLALLVVLAAVVTSVVLVLSAGRKAAADAIEPRPSPGSADPVPPPARPVRPEMGTGADQP